MCYYISPAARKRMKEMMDQEIKIGEWDEANELNGFSHPQVPVMLNTEADNIQPAVWGFIPFWARKGEAPEIMNRTLNARSETIFTKPMFQDAASKHRCLVFVNGFYEWKHEKVAGKLKKIKHFIEMPDNAPFALGGLWSRWKGGDEPITTCNVVTTTANELMATIHNSKKRMPLILAEKDWGRWLDESTSQQDVEEIMRPYPEGFLEAREI